MEEGQDVPVAACGVAPENWPQAYGYSGSRRWLACWYDPFGRACFTDDGSTTVYGGNLVVYMALLQKLWQTLNIACDAFGVTIHALGSDHEEATHILLIDTRTLDVYIGERWGILRNIPEESDRPSVNPPQPQPGNLVEPIDFSALLKWASELINEELGYKPLDHVCHNGYVATDFGYAECPRCVARKGRQ